MAGRNPYELEVDQILDAAIAIYEEDGLDAVSMRSVSGRLGVSPVPVYNRVGNKESLVDAMARRLLRDRAPAPEPDEPWPSYARRWTAALRSSLHRARDSRLVVRAACVEASKPLVDNMRANGLETDAAIQACRLLVWSTMGFVAMETGRPRRPGKPRARRRPGGDPVEVTASEADELFELHIRYLIEGIARDLAGPDRA